ncbi:hypothetical protein ACLOJK_003991 [Asimina triloba]
MAGATSASFPPPPPFYKLYKEYVNNPKSAPAPPPPIQGTYSLYGATYTTDDVLPSLEDQGVRQLYPKGHNVDYKKELRSLNRELQLHLLELADILVERPSQYARRVEDISLILKNLHHLLNSLRRHQARATLIHILELQIQRRKQAVEDIKRLLTSSSHPQYMFLKPHYEGRGKKRRKGIELMLQMDIEFWDIFTEKRGGTKVCDEFIAGTQKAKVVVLLKCTLKRETCGSEGIRREDYASWDNLLDRR